jgi:hypothetical protein
LLVPLSDQEFRREKRVTFTTRAPLATVPGHGGVIEDVSTIDLSESGVRLRFCGQVEPGQIVEVFLSKRPEPCRVVWTSSDYATKEKEIVAGLEFMYSLPDPRRRNSSSPSDFGPIN